MDSWPHIPEYELVRELGGGQLTRVFAARHVAGDFRCAIKALRPEWANDTMARQLLRREARVGLAARHPHLVKLLDAQVTRDPYFIVMELLEGESLRARLARDYSLDHRTCYWIARQAAEALSALHRTGFVHGDVKPDNIRLMNEGTAILVDLGFAHKPGEHESLIRDGYLLGTAEYLAPELSDFTSDHTFASDWFALGLVLLEMLTGESPYPPAGTAETLKMHVEYDLGPMVLRQSFGWPRPLTALLQRMLSRRPAERPAGLLVVRELIALEIAALGLRRTA